MMDYKDFTCWHYDGCEECQKGLYPKIEDCPAFKDDLSKAEAEADYLYEQEKERRAEEKYPDYPTNEKLPN